MALTWSRRRDWPEVGVDRIIDCLHRHREWSEAKTARVPSPLGKHLHPGDFCLGEMERK